MREEQDEEDAGEEGGQREADEGQRGGDLIEDRVGPHGRQRPDGQRDQDAQQLRGAQHEERGRQPLQDQRVDVDAAREGEAPVTPQHGGEPAHVADGDGIVEAELGAQVHAHLGGDVGVGGQLLERIARRHGQDGEEDEADAGQDGNQDQEAAEEVLRHAVRPVRRPPPLFLRLLEPVVQVPEVGVPAALLDAQGVADGRTTRGRNTTGMTTTFWITSSFILMNSAARLTGSSSGSRPP